jgi:steroid delta-isomerase-like uncharacterized protein
MLLADLTQTFEPLWDALWHARGRTRGVVRSAFATDFVQRISSLADPIPREDWIGFVESWQRAFPDGRMEIDDLAVRGDSVWCRWTSTGTHAEEYLGIPATQVKVKYQGVDVWRFAPDGKVADCWAVPDVLTLLRQLKALPA